MKEKLLSRRPNNTKVPVFVESQSWRRREKANNLFVKYTRVVEIINIARVDKEHIPQFQKIGSLCSRQKSFFCLSVTALYRLSASPFWDINSKLLTAAFSPQRAYLAALKNEIFMVIVHLFIFLCFSFLCLVSGEECWIFRVKKSFHHSGEAVKELRIFCFFFDNNLLFISLRQKWWEGASN